MGKIGTSQAIDYHRRRSFLQWLSPAAGIRDAASRARTVLFQLDIERSNLHFWKGSEWKRTNFREASHGQKLGWLREQTPAGTALDLLGLRKFAACAARPSA